MFNLSPASEEVDENEKNNPKKNKIGFTVNYYKSWYEQNSHSMISKLNKKFDCEYLINYYSSQKRYDIILRIASLAYLI